MSGHRQKWGLQTAVVQEFIDDQGEEFVVEMLKRHLIASVSRGSIDIESIEVRFGEPYVVRDPLSNKKLGVNVDAFTWGYISDPADTPLDKQ